MAQQACTTRNVLTAFAKKVDLFSIWEAPSFLAEVPVKSADAPASRPSAPVTASKVGPRRRVIREVVVLEAAGRLSDVIEDLDQETQLALAEEPRGVVCDLSAVLQDPEQLVVEVLATMGRHVRDWPGTPVAVACPDLRVRKALAAHPLGEHLIVTASLFSAVSEVLATPTVAVESLRLAPHPTAPRRSREFITRTLLDWRLSEVIPFASQLISLLVARSSINVGSDIDLSVAWHLGALRLTVRDHSSTLPAQRPPTLHVHGRRLAVAGLSRAFGVLPTDDGGKVVWAVLEAPRTRPLTRRIPSARATERQGSPLLTHGKGPVKAPILRGSSRQPALALNANANANAKV